MPKVLPSQVVETIDSLFGANRNELDGRAIKQDHPKRKRSAARCCETA